MSQILTRGFCDIEFKTRFVKIQVMMRKCNIDAILLTTKHDIHYFTGIITSFWESPTRPVYLILSINEFAPIAIIPNIYLYIMEKTWIKNIYTWTAPCVDDDGVSLLKDKLKIYKNLGIPMGIESQLRMPLSHLLYIVNELNINLIDVSNFIQELRLIKSSAEIEKIRNICQITSKSFNSLSYIINRLYINTKHTLTERQLIKELHKILIDNGADSVPYISGISDYNGNDTIISNPSDKILIPGEIMVIDVGCCYDQYYCDFNRNYAIGHSNSYIKSANKHLWYATEAALNSAKPGNTFHDLWKTQVTYLVNCGYDYNFFKNGRMGHSIGLQLTELPSVAKDEKTILQVGMVLTVEPSIQLNNGKLLVHEECIVITQTGYQLLSERAPIDFYYI